MIAKITGRAVSARPAPVSLSWQQRAPDVILLAAIANFFWLWRNGDSMRSYNVYYAATVKSMLTSWRNFFFASFDPAGFVTIDKPPVGFWVQAASAKLFGFSPLSLLLPQALAGVLSVALLYYLVDSAWGPRAGALAALLLAITPISVATNRDNAVDSLLVLTTLLAVWALDRAIRTGRLRPLVLCAALVGVGFNIKGMQAFMVLPAFVLLYLLASGLPWRQRMGYLALSTVALFVVSLAWVVAVDMVPPAQRPFVGSSSHDTEMDLAVGFNGLGRLTYGNPLTHLIGFGPGEPGPLRLLNRQLGGQVGWLLPLAIFALLAVRWRGWPRRPLTRRQQAFVLWGAWLLTLVAFFSCLGFFHPYYLVMLAPAIGALGGIGILALWQDYRRPGWRGWLLPLALLCTAIAQASILDSFPAWSRWLTPVVVGLSISAVGVLVVARLHVRFRSRARPGIVTAVGFLSLLVAPTLWAAFPIWHYGDGNLPFAGPDLASGVQRIDSMDDDTIAALMHYVLAHRQDRRYALATSSALVAAPLILKTGQPVMAYGGYLGTDPILSISRLTTLVTGGAVRFFLLLPSPPGQKDEQPHVNPWVRGHCALVQARLWQPAPGFGPDGPQLYDCAHAG